MRLLIVLPHHQLSISGVILLVLRPVAGNIVVFCIESGISVIRCIGHVQIDYLSATVATPGSPSFGKHYEFTTHNPDVRPHTHTHALTPCTHCPTGLGLEVWKDDRLRWKSSSDVESNAAPPQPRPARLKEATGAGAKAGRMLGQVSPRVWVIVAYLSLLHIAVMINFTRTTDVSKLCGGDKVQFMGHELDGDKVLP